MPEDSSPSRAAVNRGATRTRRPAPKGNARKKKPAPRAGTVAIVGRPNVGKSTLLNAVLGERIAITSHHPQTTRDRIAGILTTESAQLVFQDTPGVHHAKNRLGKRMNDVAEGTASLCDVVVFVTDVGPNVRPEVHDEDVPVLRTVPEGKPLLLVVNKIDRLKDKAQLLDYLAAYGAHRDFKAIIPLSAKKNDGLDRLVDSLTELLPEGEPLYPTDDISDRPVRFFVAELVREQVLLRTREEVPHGVAVTVDAFEEPQPKKGKQVTRVTLTIHVAKESHKGIIIGQGGKMLAMIGSGARARAEHLVGHQIHLDVRVRATPGWFDDAARLADLGYGETDAVKPKRKARGERR